MLGRFERFRPQHGQTEVGNFHGETAVDHAIRAVQVAVTLELAAVQEHHAFDDVVDQVILEVGLELDLSIL